MRAPHSSARRRRGGRASGAVAYRPRSVQARCMRVLEGCTVGGRQRRRCAGRGRGCRGSRGSRRYRGCASGRLRVRRRWCAANGGEGFGTLYGGTTPAPLLRCWGGRGEAAGRGPTRAMPRYRRRGPRIACVLAAVTGGERARGERERSWVTARHGAATSQNDVPDDLYVA